MNKKELHEKIAEVSKTIFSYCMARTSCREDAEDLSQDIICELIKSSNSLRDDAAFYGFMWSVASNVCKQWYRKRSAHTSAELSEDIPDEEAAFDGEDPDIYLLRRELSLLSERYRRATILYYIDRKSCSEISKALSISESMVKYLLFKSRKKLKEGLKMERNLGELSYNPKTLIPMYSGQGPNRFWDFMQSKIRQNIVSACYNDSLTLSQISLETGIPLPYLEDDVKELESKKIIIKDGSHYKANVLIITSECMDEAERDASKYYALIADKAEAFISDDLSKYKNIGFIGNDFSDNTLRWQLAVILFRMLAGVDCGEKCGTDVPQTGWGERAYLWCFEKLSDKHIFNCAGVDGKHGDSLYFFDYWKDGKGKGDHMDFYGNERYINIFLDICRGEKTPLSEYDLEAVAEMIKKGYVIKENDTYRSSMPIYTTEQYNEVIGMVKGFISAELAEIIHETNKTTARIISSHAPKHLQDQVQDIASIYSFINSVCIPALMLIDRQVLSTAWHPLEMPTTYAVLNK